MYNTGELKEGIALVEKGLVHGPGNADLLDILDKVRLRRRHPCFGCK